MEGENLIADAELWLENEAWELEKIQFMKRQAFREYQILRNEKSENEKESDGK